MWVFNDVTGEFDIVPDNPRINEFLVVGSSVRYEGDVVTLQWDVQDAANIYINNERVISFGSIHQLRLTNVGVHTFTLKICNGDLTISQSVSIQVLPIPSIDITLSAPKLRKGKNEICNIQWNILNAYSVKLKNGTEESIENNQGLISVSPIDTQDYTFEIIGLDRCKQFNRTVCVEVFPESDVNFKVDKLITLPQVPIKLSWNVINALKVELLGKGVVHDCDEEIMEIDRDTDFILQVTDPFGIKQYPLRVRIYPLQLIRTILVPIPRIEKNINMTILVSRPNIDIHLHLPKIESIEVKQLQDSFPIKSIYSSNFSSCRAFTDNKIKLSNKFIEGLNKIKQIINRISLWQH